MHHIEKCMKEQSKPSIIITKFVPLIIQDEDYCREYACVTLKQGGYIQALVDCSIRIDKLIKVESETSKDDPDIIVKGKDGIDGKPGIDGTDGGKGAIAEIMIDDLQSNLNVYVYGGGCGGMGGRGGDGGDGGDGAPGANGGNGGGGGDGANGGDGGFGGQLTIRYQTQNGSEIVGSELEAEGGQPGVAGEGGTGGKGKIDGKSGKKGKAGNAGKSGKKGTLIIDNISEGGIHMSNQTQSFVSRHLDFSDPKDKAKILKDLGGEDLLKSNYPEVYTAFLKTVEKHEQQKGNLGTTNPMGLSGGAFAEPISITKDTTALKGNVVDGSELKGSIQGVTFVQGGNPWARGYVNGYMMNQTQNIFLSTCSKKLTNENYYEYIHKCNVEDITTIGNQNIQNYIICKGILADKTMEYLESNSNVFVVKGSDSTVAYMKMDAPRSKVNNNPIVMMYARSPDHGETIDYDYPNNHIIDGTDKVKTLFPVKGSITFNDDFKPQKFSLESKCSKPILQYKKKGVCEYNYTYEEIAACFKISDHNSQVVEFELKEDWKMDLDISAYTSDHASRDISFVFSFFFETATEFGIEEIPILITSTVDAGKRFYESTDDTNVYLPLIYIKWGCFAKETMILMSDRKEKKISEIMIGEMLMGENGELLRVVDRITGKEERIFCIRTKKKKLLRVTQTHPIATADGIVRAEDLKPGMLLRCTDGTEDEIEFVYINEYDDIVYNLITEGGSRIIAANGIWAGDFELQNDNTVMKQKVEPVSEEMSKLTQQFNQLLDHLESLQS